MTSTVNTIKKQLINTTAVNTYFCYLLRSEHPTCHGDIYIGFTINPIRRLRQHNGIIGAGAKKTARKRPWSMILCIYGFTSKILALQFEWMWVCTTAPPLCDTFNFYYIVTQGMCIV